MCPSSRACRSAGRRRCLPARWWRVGAGGGRWLHHRAAAGEAKRPGPWSPSPATAPLHRSISSSILPPTAQAQARRTAAARSTPWCRRRPAAVACHANASSGGRHQRCAYSLSTPASGCTRNCWKSQAHQRGHQPSDTGALTGAGCLQQRMVPVSADRSSHAFNFVKNEP